MTILNKNADFEEVKDFKEMGNPVFDAPGSQFLILAS